MNRLLTNILKTKIFIGEVMQDRTSLPSWQKLEDHVLEMKSQHMSELFKKNSPRHIFRFLDEESTIRPAELTVVYLSNQLT